MADSYYIARYVRGRGWEPVDILSTTLWLEDDPETLACCTILDSTASYSFFVDNLVLPGRSRYLSRIANSIPIPPGRKDVHVCRKRAWLRSSAPIPKDFAEAVACFMIVAGLDDNLNLCPRFWGMICMGGPGDFEAPDLCDMYPLHWTTFQFDGSTMLPLIPVCEFHRRAWEEAFADCPCYAFYPITG